MLLIKIILPLFISCMIGCTVNKSKNGKKYGKWIYKTKTDVSKGRYSKGNEVGIWKDFQNGNLIRKERYTGNIATVKNYYRGKKIESKGQTIIDRTPKQIHWYYHGDWLYYDEKGKLKEKVTYINGDQIVSQKY